MTTTEPEITRLNKYLALQLGISRREADELIEEGSVAINDTVATLGARIASTDTISVKGKPVAASTEYSYILFYKPAGYVCSRRKQGESDTIYTLLPKTLHHLKPVGRLDRDTSGLLMLTNDGDTAYQMTHPKFYKVKTYKVRLDHDLEPLHQQMINDFGVQLEDGPSKLSLERLSETNRKEWQITMHEGRNRQIRRTFASLGYKAVKLHRTQFGPYSLSAHLKPGEYEHIQL